MLSCFGIISSLWREINGLWQRLGYKVVAEIIVLPCFIFGSDWFTVHGLGIL